MEMEDGREVFIKWSDTRIERGMSRAVIRATL